MHLTFTNAALGSVLKLTTAVVSESKLSTEIKDKVIGVSKVFYSALNNSTESAFHRSYVHELTGEHHVEVDEAKVIALVEVYMRHRLLFVGLFNIFATTVMSVLTIREMILNAPQKLGLMGENLIDDVEKVRALPTNWKNQTPPLASETGEDFHLRHIFANS